MKKNIAIILTIIVTLIVVLSLIYYLYLVPQVSYLSVKELNENEILGSLTLPVGKVYHVEDKVEKVIVFSLPELKENYSANFNNLSTYSAVWFESVPSIPIFFLGDKSSDFPRGKEVKFELEVEKYETLFSGSPFTITCLESRYVLNIIMELHTGVYIGNFAIISFELDRIDDENFTLTVTQVMNFNSPSICWSDVYVDSPDRTKPLPSFKVYSSDSSFLGEFRERNLSMIGEEVEVADYLDFTFDKNTYGNLTLIFGADILSAVSNPLEPFFFNEFPISHVDI